MLIKRVVFPNKICGNTLFDVLTEKFKPLFFLVLCSLLCQGHTLAAYKPLSAEAPKTIIRKLAEKTAIDSMEIPENSKATALAMPIDPRFVIPECPQGFQATMKASKKYRKNKEVKVTCPNKDNKKPWSMHLKVRTAVLYPVVVAKEPLFIGQKISSMHLDVDYKTKREIRGPYFSTIDELHGARLKKRLNQGRQINAQMVCFVCKGDIVSIEIESNHLNLKTIGQAKSDGNIGESIKVRNKRSDKIIDATVNGVGKVNVKI